MFEGCVWSSRCHGKKSPMTWIAILDLVLLFAMILSLALLGYGPVSYVFVALLVAALIATCVMGVRFKWYNPHLIFELTGTCLMAYSEYNPSTYFYIEYDDIKNFVYTEHPDGLCTVMVNFKQRTSAGTWARNIKWIELVRIEAFDSFKQTMTSHGVEGIQKTKAGT